MRLAPVIPVLVVDEVAHAAPLARALFEGGLKVLEITLRTPQALAVIEAMARAVPQAVIAAGTVTTPAQLAAAQSAGAQFAVSPGLTPALAEATQHPGALPLLPGVATASELMMGLDAGLDRFKLFPAEAVGGIRLLQSLHGPFAQAVFCPTGGITLESAPRYLALPNVACVGGSWLAPKAALAAGRWDEIRALAQQAAALAQA
ncbi:bifunctional 4-hydroxy-2-oxoglutarate aldolase/2-dehydro-3-deoxy-phosphogluconate aldolase [Aquabacterium soli]|uniref:2-dehydro-3-deoxy-phosphogluconate aldolase n=2 Tax=Aquabacterium soli TaxID=2493092 RepID=A0A426V7A7_9BURK|nr:bifunctional 4-hydroxy-2-oxoglutarate aldolase/2-dehydro-3-deoxy-phosphogluconate aldolase [Aquabacterium soli]